MSSATKDRMAETCFFCGDEYYIEVFEYYPEESTWVFETCCEGAYEDAIAHMHEDPRGFARWFEGQVGVSVRRPYDSWQHGNTRLDYGLRLEPISRSDAQKFVSEHHRHNAAPVSDRWRFAVMNGSDMVAVGIAGNPQARLLGTRVYCPRHRTTEYVSKKAIREGTAEWPTCSHSVKRPAAKSWPVECELRDPCGRPVLVDGPCGREMVYETAEVTRVCVDTSVDPELVWNACTLLYGAFAEQAKAAGYDRIVTFTHAEEETGATLAKAAGWFETYHSKREKRGWHRDNGRQRKQTESKPKVRWELGLNKKSKKDVRQRADALAAKVAKRAAREAKRRETQA